MLPFSYAARNLLRDPWRFVQKTLGAALVVLLILAAGAFDAGMREVLQASGSDRTVLLLGAGSEESVERSEVSPQVEGLAAAAIPGAVRRLGQPAVSGEVHYMGLVSLPGEDATQAILRGITPAAFAVHPEARIIEGTYPGSGKLLVGRLAHRRLGLPEDALKAGRPLELEGETFEVAGIFEAPGTVLESELWLDRNDLMAVTRRDALSCVLVRLEEASAFGQADLFARQRLDLELVALRESDYYAKLSAFFRPLRGMTWMTSFLIATGAVLGGLNMLYAAFASRIRELATLQAIGFRRRAILLSLVQESLLTTLTGTLVAAFVAVWLLEGVTVPFSIGTFTLRISAGVLGAGVGLGVLLGLVGAVPAAVRCLGAPLPTALRSS